MGGCERPGPPLSGAGLSQTGQGGVGWSGHTHLLNQEVPDLLDDVVAGTALLQRLQAALLQPAQEVAVHLQQVVRTWEQAADGLGAELQLLPQRPGVDLEHDLESPHMVGLCLHQLCGDGNAGISGAGGHPG